MSHDHRPDGRLRLAAALLVSVTAALTRELDSLTIMLGLTLLAIPFAVRHAQLSVNDLAQRLLAVNLFVLAIWLTVPLDWATLSLRTDRVHLAAQLSLRVNLLVVSVTLLLTGMNGIELARAAIALGVPRSLGALLALAVRQIALLSSTRVRLERAMRARAYRPRLGWRTLEVSAQLVAWLIIHALVRSERLEMGLKVRGATASSWPTRPPSHWHALPRSEWLLLLGVALALVLALALPRIGWG